MAVERKPTNMRFTETGKRLLERLATRRGISQAAVLEQLVRDEAERQGIRDDVEGSARPGEALATDTGAGEGSA